MRSSMTTAISRPREKTSRPVRKSSAEARTSVTDDHTTALLPPRRQFAAKSPAALSKGYVGSGTIVDVTKPMEILRGRRVVLAGQGDQRRPDRQVGRLPGSGV